MADIVKDVTVSKRKNDDERPFKVRFDLGDRGAIAFPLSKELMRRLQSETDAALGPIGRNAPAKKKPAGKPPKARAKK